VQHQVAHPHGRTHNPTSSSDATRTPAHNRLKQTRPPLLLSFDCLLQARLPACQACPASLAAHP
jgi:hypothetical protein